ncbi:MAG: DUF3866 family protein [Actinomycetes bacterium]
MPTFRRGEVLRILESRPGLQRVEVALADGPARAYVLTGLTGEVAPGERVILNTTAVELGLGTGGWHVVHWSLDRDEFVAPGPGHIMKLRYTSLQADTGSAEEFHPGLADAQDLGGMPVVHVPLHSQVPAAVLGVRSVRPDARIAYVMTDGASLPLALSDLVAAMSERSLIDATVTAGHAFGGDLEAVSAPSALLAARIAARADVAIVAMGPGIVGTGSRFGHTGVEAPTWLGAAADLGGDPIAALRVSFADPRERHRGLSHHSATALGRLGTARATVVVPAVGGDEEARIPPATAAAGIAARHEVVTGPAPDVLGAFASHGLSVGSMGRPASADPVLFLAAGAAGALAGTRIPAR